MGGGAPIITEERLLRTVQSQLGPQVQQLLAPPAVPPGVSVPDPRSPQNRIGVPVALFPRWMFCPRCQRLAPLSTGLFERRDDAWHPDRTRYVHMNCDAPKAGQPTVVPARFLVACPNGHLDDFPWIEFVHRGPTDCKASLRLIEFGPSGEARDLEVRCDTCGKRRRLAEAFGDEGRAWMPRCRGRRPHLRDYDETACDAQATTILVGASNLWFPDVATTLERLPQAATLTALVVAAWQVSRLLACRLLEHELARRATQPASPGTCPQCGRRLESKQGFALLHHHRLSGLQKGASQCGKTRLLVVQMLGNH